MRHPFKLSIVAIIAVVLAYQLGRYINHREDSQLSGSRAPYIQQLTSNSVTIHWLTEDDEIGVVRFGQDPAHLSVTQREGSPAQNHIVTLRNLQPGTTYYYQTGSTNRFRSLSVRRERFQTAPAGNTDTRVWVMGDSGEAGDIVHDVKTAALDWMKQHPLAHAGSSMPGKTGPGAPVINVWIALGDIAYEFGSNEQYQAALFDVFGDLTGNTALWPVYGNHDERREAYFRIFDLPENGEAGGVSSHTGNYYSIDYSNAHFVMLDSVESDRTPTGPMARWLKADLAQNSKPWVIAAFHHPPYSKGSHDSDDEDDSAGRMEEMRQYILPILEDGGVDVVLSGHSHSYERSYLIDCAYDKSHGFSAGNIVSMGVDQGNKHFLKPLHAEAHQGAIYVVAGSSSKVGTGTFDHPAHFVSFDEPGSVVMDISGNHLVARFINERGEVKDEFSIDKTPDFVARYPGCHPNQR
jgi:hypothetical protein